MATIINVDRLEAGFGAGAAGAVGAGASAASEGESTRAARAARVARAVATGTRVEAGSTSVLMAA
jgi:hypothetical protein